MRPPKPRDIDTGFAVPTTNLSLATESLWALGPSERSLHFGNNPLNAITAADVNALNAVLNPLAIGLELRARWPPLRSPVSLRSQLTNQTRVSIEGLNREAHPKPPGSTKRPTRNFSFLAKRLARRVHCIVVDRGGRIGTQGDVFLIIALRLSVFSAVHFSFHSAFVLLLGSDERQVDGLS